MNIGIVNMENKNYDPAAEKFVEALKLFKKLGDERGAAASLTNLGIIDAEKGNHTEAIKKYEEALEIAIRIRDKYNTDLILKNIIALNK